MMSWVADISLIIENLGRGFFSKLNLRVPFCKGESFSPRLRRAAYLPFHPYSFQTFLHKYHGPHSSGEPVVALLAAHFGWSALKEPILTAVSNAYSPTHLARTFGLLLDIAPPDANPRDFDTTGMAGVFDEGFGMKVGIRAAGRVRANFLRSDESSAEERARVEACAETVALIMAENESMRVSVHWFHDWYREDRCLFGLYDMTATAAYLQVLERYGLGPFAALTKTLAKNLIGVSLTSATELLFRIAVEKGVGCTDGALSRGAIGFCQSLAGEIVDWLNDELDVGPNYPNPARSPDWVRQLLLSFHSLEIPLETIGRSSPTSSPRPDVTIWIRPSSRR